VSGSPSSRLASTSLGHGLTSEAVAVQPVLDSAVPRPLTVKVEPPAGWPPAPLTDTGYVPEASPSGTYAVMVVSDQLSILAWTDPKYTVPSPWVLPKCVPVMVNL
jgi:hypothetical protein